MLGLKATPSGCKCFVVALSRWLRLHIKCGEEWSQPADVSTAQATSVSDAFPHLSVSLDTQQQCATRLWLTALIDAEVALARPGKAVHVDETRVVVNVGLPDGGMIDVVDHFMETIPGYVELVRVTRLWQCLFVLSPRKRVDEMSSYFPLDFPPLTRLLSRRC